MNIKIGNREFKKELSVKDKNIITQAMKAVRDNPKDPDKGYEVNLLLIKFLESKRIKTKGSKKIDVNIDEAELSKTYFSFMEGYNAAFLEEAKGLMSS